MSSSSFYQDLKLDRLPIDDCLTDLLSALQAGNNAVLVAPPGAGKTSRVPLALLNEHWNSRKRILVLEPRRLAARAAAEHMAALIGEKPGQTVGYRVRLDSKVGPRTRIELITEGVFTRMILADPELPDVGAVLFDEIHERNLEGDLGLALALDVQSSLREDLRLLPMSATLDGARVAELLNNAGVIESKGRSFPVHICYQQRSVNERLEDHMAAAVHNMLTSQSGSILCFLPGLGEIKRTAQRLVRLPQNVDLHQLHGSMKPQDQRAAIAPPAPGRRKVVLATSIAQTSLTLADVQVVIDSGLARVPRLEAATGLTRLETVRASRAAINQRAGRAGRTREGVCLRLWHEGQTSALPEQDRPEILEAELSNLVLDLAAWGVSDPNQLVWIDRPPTPAWYIAISSLVELEAIDGQGRITRRGKKLRGMPLPPRLAHMVLKAAEFDKADLASLLALIITERGIAGNDIDLSVRLEKIAVQNDSRTQQMKTSARNIVAGLAEETADSFRSRVEDISAGVLISFAWPDRIAQNKGPDQQGNASFLMANGRRAKLSGISPLAKFQWLAVCEVQGKAASASILSAAPITMDEILQHHSPIISNRREVDFDASSGKFKAIESVCLGKIRLSQKPVPIVAGDAVEEDILKHFRQVGLDRLFEDTRCAVLRDRLAFLHARYPDRFKPVDDDTLSMELENWLAPMISGATTLSELTAAKVTDGLKLYAGFENLPEIDRLAPEKIGLPSGINHRLDYGTEEVTLRARVQEFYSVIEHPTICDGAFPVTLELLSPAMRPIQKTRDIAGFWRGSWADVRKEMRGRYPKHVWPDDPASASPITKSGQKRKTG